MNRNLGQSALKRRRRGADPMRAYDALPGPLRHWLAQAALPWSPISARKAWDRARAKGMGEAETLAYLSRCEAGTLQKEARTLTARGRFRSEAIRP